LTDPIRTSKASALSMAFLICAATCATGQEAQAPPDYSGIWVRTYVVDQTYDPPLSGRGPIGQDPRYPSVNARGEPRQPLSDEDREKVVAFTRNWVGDAQDPLLQPATRAALESVAQDEIAGLPHPQPQTMCMASGTPLILNTAPPIQILQTHDEVLFLYSRNEWTRHVRLNAKHRDDPTRTWWGDSIGHYEGDTLVVDTIHQNDRHDVDRFGTRHSDRIHVVERYRRSDDGTRIEAEFTVEDPVAFTKPWSGRANFEPDEFGFLEIICAENQRDFWPGRVIYFPQDETPDF
jgi:hypothetical protein